MDFYSQALSLALKTGVLPTQTTPVGDLKRFLQNLHPIRTDKELIRIGPEGDGGYLLPDDFEGISACFSPGVCDESGFEFACAERGMNVFMADASVDGPSCKHGNFHFMKKFIGVAPGGDYITFDDWLIEASLGDDGDLMLQMDIEGAEYEVLLSLNPQIMNRFRIMVIEFHNLQWFWSLPFYRVASAAFRKVLQTHSCVHIHPNNASMRLRKEDLEMPQVMEFTFLRNDRVTQSGYVKEFPHKLDCDNVAKYDHYALPSCWYRH